MSILATAKFAIQIARETLVHQIATTLGGIQSICREEYVEKWDKCLGRITQTDGKI